jgi:hypothetical protein
MEPRPCQPLLALPSAAALAMHSTMTAPRRMVIITDGSNFARYPIFP